MLFGLYLAADELIIEDEGNKGNHINLFPIFIEGQKLISLTKLKVKLTLFVSANKEIFYTVSYVTQYATTAIDETSDAAAAEEPPAER